MSAGNTMVQEAADLRRWEPAELLAPHGRRLLDAPEAAVALREEYERMGVLQVDDFADAERLLGLGRILVQELAPLSLPTVLAPSVQRAGDKPVLSSGHRFGRLDPGFFRAPDERRERMETKFRELGLTRLGETLSVVLDPFVRFIVGTPVEYQKIYFFLYTEGDYIGPHTDRHTGDRVNVQFPIPLAAASGFRALHDGELALYYDTPGCLRILGPEVWHEVLPVLRVKQDEAPGRILISLRYR